MSVPEDAVSRLLENGQEIPDDPVEIERLLAEQELADPEDEPDPEPKPEPKPNGDEPGDNPEKEAEAGKKSPDDAKTGEKPVDEPTKEPPAALLRTYRSSLHERDEQLKARDEELEGKNTEIEGLQGKLALALSNVDTEAKDLQGKVDEVTDTDVKLEDLTPERIAEIREEAGDEAADLLEVYAKQFTAQSARLDKLEEANTALQQKSEDVESQKLMTDLDSVPLLSVLAASRGDNADERWARTLSYEKAVRADPDWIDKSRREVYEEVGRRMESHLGTDAVKELTGAEPASKPANPKPEAKTDSHDEVIDEALKNADNSAIPTSLSDLPAGEVAPASENERAQGMSIVDVEAAIDKAFDKGGSDAVDEALTKFMTADDA